MKLLKILAIVATILTISGCTQNLWFKQNAGQGEFERDRYSCLQQSQQRVGAAQVNAYGGSAVDTVDTNNVLFSTCMGSKGWSFQNKEVIQAQVAQNQAKYADLKQQSDLLNTNINAMCNKDELKEYYKKTACMTVDISFEQIADATKITPAQKTALIKQQGEVALLNKEREALQRQGGEVGIKLVSINTNFVRPENEKNNLDLYNEKITWGEYNKRRKEILTEGNKRLRQ
jgi:hypothetical protein